MSDGAWPQTCKPRQCHDDAIWDYYALRARSHSGGDLTTKWCAQRQPKARAIRWFYRCANRLGARAGACFSFLRIESSGSVASRSAISTSRPSSGTRAATGGESICSCRGVFDGRLPALLMECDALNLGRAPRGPAVSGSVMRGCSPSHLLTKGATGDTGMFAAIDNRNGPAAHAPIRHGLRPDNCPTPGGQQRERLSDMTRLVRGQPRRPRSSKPSAIISVLRDTLGHGKMPARVRHACHSPFLAPSFARARQCAFPPATCRQTVAEIAPDNCAPPVFGTVPIAPPHGPGFILQGEAVGH